MGKIRPEPDPKSGLVSEICSISSSRVSCIHNSNNAVSATSCFIDWYLILGVKEDAEVDVIRKRYHKLALQIHPDKNNHPNAEIAFKLIYEAYSCLSDKSKRRSFNSERQRNFCPKCNRIPYQTKENSRPRTNAKPSQYSRTLKDIRDRFREENKVIERCLKANNPRFPRNQTEETPIFGITNRFGKESPVFDPSVYGFWGYPHVRNRPVSEKSQGFWYLREEQQTRKNIIINGLPVFEKNMSDCRMCRSKSTCVRSS